MKAKEGIVDFLNKVLTNELTAINQYFVHAEMCDHWGYARLYDKIRAHSMEEMKDAEEIIEHILYLEGVPNVQRLGQIQVGETVPEHLKLDLRLEQEAVALLTEAIAQCAKVGDYTTRHKLEKMAEREEGHIDWIETQLETIKQVGIENYLSQQIHKEE
jgi:bacterioferritin